MKNSFLSEMRSRGYLNQCTDLDNLEKISKEKTIKPILDLIVQLLVYTSEVYFRL